MYELNIMMKYHNKHFKIVSNDFDIDLLQI